MAIIYIKDDEGKKGSRPYVHKATVKRAVESAVNKALEKSVEREKVLRIVIGILTLGLLVSLYG